MQILKEKSSRRVPKEAVGRAFNHELEFNEEMALSLALSRLVVADLSTFIERISNKGLSQAF